MAAASKAEVIGAGAEAPETVLARKLYADMLLIRRFEEKAGQLYGNGPDRRLLPPLHRTGSGGRRHAAALQPGDQVITAYRDHGHMLATVWIRRA